jgi:hypothetical protein
VPYRGFKGPRERGRRILKLQNRMIYSFKFD